MLPFTILINSRTRLEKDLFSTNGRYTQEKIQMPKTTEAQNSKNIFKFCNKKSSNHLFLSEILPFKPFARLEKNLRDR